MTRKHCVKNGARFLIGVMIICVTAVCTQPGTGWAMLAPAQGSSGPAVPEFDRAADMKTIQTTLESKIVNKRLKALGMSDTEIKSRLDRLSDKQIHQLAKDVSAIGSGGGLLTLLEIVLVVLLIVFLLRVL